MSVTQVLFPDSVIPVKSEGDLLVALPDSTLGIYTSQPAGIKGIPHIQSPAASSWISLLLILCFLVVTASYRSSNKFIQYIVSEIFDYKERSGFHQKSTLNMVRLKAALLFMTFLIEGLALFVVFTKFEPRISFSELKDITLVGAFSACFAFFYLSQLAVYSIISYTFTNKTNAGMISGTLTGITILRGLLLFIPVLISIYHSIPLNIFIFITISLYFATRILFIYKGVKIFFSDFYRLIYVVLYLCTFEIAPLLVIYKGLFLLFSFVELKLF
ncbi:MAG: DUF4271 domain-containing protein [Bacteroidales bacterium]